VFSRIQDDPGITITGAFFVPTANIPQDKVRFWDMLFLQKDWYKNFSQVIYQSLPPFFQTYFDFVFFTEEFTIF